MTRLGPLSWRCLGATYPFVPCGEEGDTNAGAERHVRETGHTTMTSQRPKEGT